MAGERPARIVLVVVLGALAVAVLLAAWPRQAPVSGRASAAATATPQPASPAETLRVAGADLHVVARLDAALVTQVQSPWMVDGPAASTDCGPAAMAAALRLAGLDVPGAAVLHDRRLLARARQLATGSTAGTGRVGAYTYLPQLARLAHAAGARTRVTPSVAAALAWSQAGVPVVLQGAPLRAWDARLPSSIVRHVAGGHYVVLAGPVADAPGWWWLLEPLGVRGPVAVTTGEVERFVADWNGAAMAVLPGRSAVR